MSAIRYVALRELETVLATITATDISAAAADDSFNASPTSLLGILADQWVLVAGFANAANNGWFQLLSNSTTGKITLKDAALVNESAGPTITIKSYKRGINQEYDLEFYSERVDRSVRITRSSKQPMGGGAPEVLVQRREPFIDVTVLGPNGELLTEAQLLQWREFLASVEGGESFTLDRYGTVAAPVEPLTCMMASEEYSEERVASMRRYKISFQVRVL